MENKVFEIIARVFSVPVESIKVEMLPSDFANWNSLNHMNLILELESELGIQFDNEEIAELISIDAIIKVISRKA